MKKIFFAALVALTVLLVSCTSIRPVQGLNSYPAGNSYKILGRVTISTSSSQSGYTKLLEEAKKQYAACDDVINIMVDAKTSSFLFFTSHTYTMSAIAVDYTDM